MTTTLTVGFFMTTYYWLEVSNYSTFDRNYNNTIYPRLSIANIFTNTNTFNTYLPTSTLTPTTGTQLITKTYADSNFLDRTNNLTQSINGVKTFNAQTTFNNSSYSSILVSKRRYIKF
jgi:hypothetical protein